MDSEMVERHRFFSSLGMKEVMFCQSLEWWGQKTCKADMLRMNETEWSASMGRKIITQLLKNLSLPFTDICQNTKMQRDKLPNVFRSKYRRAEEGGKYTCLLGGGYCQKLSSGVCGTQGDHGARRGIIIIIIIIIGINSHIMRVWRKIGRDIGQVSLDLIDKNGKHQNIHALHTLLDGPGHRLDS